MAVISRLEVVGRNRGGKRHNPFAKTFQPTEMPEGYDAGDPLVAEIESEEFGTRLIVWDCEDAEYFYGISMDEFVRGMTETYGRPYSRLIWTVNKIVGFDNLFGGFDAWVEIDYLNGGGI